MMILYVSRRSRARCQRTRSREQKKSLTLPKHCLSFSSSLPLVSSLYFSFCVLSCALHVTHHRDKISITVSKNSHSHTTGVINDQPPTIVLYPHTIVLHSTCLHTIVLYLYHRLAQNLHANRLVPTCHAGKHKAEARATHLVSRERGQQLRPQDRHALEAQVAPLAVAFACGQPLPLPSGERRLVRLRLIGVWRYIKRDRSSVRRRANQRFTNYEGVGGLSSVAKRKSRVRIEPCLVEN